MITHLLRLMLALSTYRNRLALEKVALRHQITVMKRISPQARMALVHESSADPTVIADLPGSLPAEVLRWA